jgi:Orsellinic acid/F9775 biosynthesis cluster protein D
MSSITLPNMIDPDDYLVYLNERKVLVCRPCKYALQNTGVKRHLKEKHQVIPNAVRKVLVEYTQSLSLLPFSQVRMPSITESIPAFDCLKLFENGCRCIQCNELCSMESSMIVHCRKHNWTKSQG